MNVVFLAKGTCTLGMTKRDKDGNVTTSESAQFNFDGTGGSVAVGEMDPETNVIDTESVSIFGDWDAAGYLAEALKLLQPRRSVNLPNLKAIVQAAYCEDGNDLLCDYCNELNCPNCIIQEWKEELG